jgi:phospholipase/carboxylesterase
MQELLGPEIPQRIGSNPKQLIVFLHGYGSDGHDLISLAHEFAEILPEAYFLSPNAPDRCEMSSFGYQWFSLYERTEEVLFEQISQVSPLLENYLYKQLQRFNLTEDKLVLIGFSQGTMMSLHVSLRLKKACKAVIGFSGALIGAKFLNEDNVVKPNILLVHGLQDDVVPVSASNIAKEVLEKLNVPVTLQTYSNLMHGINAEGIEVAKNFLIK